jgi:hypothetical protein
MQVTKPKKFGGLGLRKLEVMNDNCFLKLGWELPSNDTKLWCAVLRGKYDRGNMNESVVMHKPTDSSLWRSLVKFWPRLSKFEFWIVGNGEKVNAWTSNWIDTNLCVADFEVSISNALSNARVVDLVDANGEWISGSCILWMIGCRRTLCREA